MRDTSSPRTERYRYRRARCGSNLRRARQRAGYRRKRRQLNRHKRNRSRRKASFLRRLRRQYSLLRKRARGGCGRAARRTAVQFCADVFAGRTDRFRRGHIVYKSGNAHGGRGLGFQLLPHLQRSAGHGAAISSISATTSFRSQTTTCSTRAVRDSRQP